MSDFGYIVVGNFQSLYDDTLEKHFNKASGLTNFSFMMMIAEFAERHEREIIHRLDDTVIMRGTEDHMKRLRFENGDRFSYAFTDKEGVEKLRYAEDEAQEYRAYHGTYETGKRYHNDVARLDA